MMECDICKKSYKNEKTLTIHQKKYHFDYYNNQRNIVQFEYFEELPYELQFEILKHLSARDLLSCYYTKGIEIFKSKFNYLWRPYIGNKLANVCPNRKLSFTSLGISWVKYINSLCFYCWKSTLSTHIFYNLPMCSNCRTEKLPMITKTKAKTMYKLKDKDLVKLSHYETRNPYYRCAPPMILYLEDDIKHYSYHFADNKT